MSAVSDQAQHLSLVVGLYAALPYVAYCTSLMTSDLPLVGVQPLLMASTGVWLVVNKRVIIADRAPVVFFLIFFLTCNASFVLGTGSKMVLPQQTTPQG